MNLKSKFLNNWPELSFRTLFSLIFIVAGYGHILNPDKIVARLLKAPGADLVIQLADPKLMVLLTGVVLFSSGIALLFGLRIRIAAMTLIGVLIPITLSVQIGTQDLGPLFKNIALFGGLIYFAFRNQSGVEPSSENLGSSALLCELKRIRIKTVIATILTLGAVFSAGLAYGNATTPSKAQLTHSLTGVSFLVREPNHIKAALLTAQQILSAQIEFKASSASIVICGPSGVAVAVRGHEMEKDFIRAKDNGIDVSVCGLTLKEKNIDPAAITDSVRIVENGMVEILRLQKLGYDTVQL